MSGGEFDDGRLQVRFRPQPTAGGPESGQAAAGNDDDGGAAVTEHQDHDHGSPWSADSANAATQAVAADAVRLLGSLQDWARRSFPAPTAGSSGAAECQWCPLCQFASRPAR